MLGFVSHPACRDHDAGYDTLTVSTTFAQGTRLVEQTGRTRLPLPDGRRLVERIAPDRRGDLSDGHKPESSSVTRPVEDW